MYQSDLTENHLKMREFVFLFCWLFVRKVLCSECGGVLEDASGWITAPDADGDGLYDKNADCWWVIVAQNNSAVEISFHFLDLQKHIGCINDVLEVYDGQSFLASFCGDASAPSILGKSQSLIIHFQSDSDVSAGGFNISYRQVVGWHCGSTELLNIGYFSPVDVNSDGLYDNDLFCNWDLKSIMNDCTIRLYITRFDIAESDNCTLDFLMVYTSAEAYGIYCGTTRPPLFQTTLSVLSIAFFSTCCLEGKGFTALYTMQQEPCGQILTDKTGIIQPTDTDDDGIYDNNQNCWWVMVAPDHGVVEFEFLEIAVEFSSGCEYDYIQIYDDEATSAAVIYWACGFKNPPIVRTNTSILLVQFYSDSDAGDTGFTAEYRHAWPCGSTETYNIHQFGSVDTDGDGFYDHNMDCVWFIKDLLSSKTIQLYLAKFDIPSNINCSEDNLQIYDDVKSYGVFCGAHRPSLITTTQRVLSVEFHTECCLNGGGFLAVYSMPGNCGGLLTEPSGVIQSHNKDRNDKYDDHANCWWGVIAHDDQIVEIEFLSMAIQESESCDYDYIQLYDGEVSLQAAIGYYCGYTLPPRLRTRTNVLYLQFISDASITDFGFTANYIHSSAIPCGATEIDIVGFFHALDADADGFYDSNLDCVWDIHAFNHDRIINFYVAKYDVPPSNSCTLDYLKIYDEGQTYGVFCGADRPGLIKTTRAVLTVEFHSDCCGNGIFKAVYTQEDGECGHILTQPTGEFQSVDRDNDGLYDADLYCTWVLVGPDDGHIELSISSLLVEWTKQCSKDSLRVIDHGFGLTDDVVGLCGTLDEQTFQSTENILYLLFWTDSEHQFAGWTAKYRHIHRTGKTNSREPTTMSTTEQGTVEISSQASPILITVEATDKVETTKTTQTNRQTTGQATDTKTKFATRFLVTDTQFATRSLATDTQMSTVKPSTADPDVKLPTGVTSKSIVHTSSTVSSKACDYKQAFTCHLLIYMCLIFYALWFC